MINNEKFYPSMTNVVNFNLGRKLILKNCGMMLNIFKNDFLKTTGIDNFANKVLFFISITTKNGITKRIILTKEELSVLKFAVNNNGNVTTLCDKIDSARSLFVKGLLELSDNGDFVVTNKIAEFLIKTQKADSYLITDDKLSEKLDNANEYSGISWGNL